MFDVDDALEAMTELSFRNGYPMYTTLQTLIGMFSSKNSPKVELKDLLPAFANPFVEEGDGHSYHPEFARLMRKLVDAHLAPEWLLSGLNLNALYRS